MFETEALKALGPFPLVQAVLALVIVGGGIYALLRGNRERNGSGSTSVPPWAVVGPVHDATRAIQDVAEQSRETIKLLERIEENSRASAETMRHLLQMLEMIRNESRLR